MSRRGAAAMTLLAGWLGCSTAGPSGDAYLALDTDGDGALDWLEIMAATDPEQASSVPADANDNGVYDVFEGSNESSLPCANCVTATDIDLASLDAYIDERIRGYVRANCYFVFGWRDGCSGCPAAQASRKGWVRADGSCAAGPGTSCDPWPLDWGAEPLMVTAVNLNTAGDVDGTDDFFVALHCE
jgi:hypothetical protein